MNRKKLLLKFLLIRRRFSLKNLPIIAKLIICFSLFALFTILLSFTNFTNYKNDKEQTTLDTIRQYNNQAVTKIDDYMKDLNNITKFPLFRKSEEQDFMKSLELFDDNNTKSVSFISSCNQIFYEILNYKKYIQSAFIFNTKGMSQYVVVGSGLSQDYVPTEEEWFKQSIKGMGKYVIVNTFLLPNVSEIHNKPVYVFSMARGIVRLPYPRVLGVILINTDVDFLADICKKMLITPGQRIVIIDEAGNTLYDTIETNITKKLESSIFENVSAKDSGAGNYGSGNEYSMISYTTSEYTGWKIVNIIPLNELNKDLNKMALTTTIVTFISILAAFILILLVSSQIVTPIKRLMLLMKLVEKGNFDVKVKLESRDEIGVLARAFNSMSNKINKLINEVYVDRIKQKDLELQMLQSQMNPHFLYNSLDAINMMAEINNDKETSHMAMSLGKILRYGISRNKSIVTIREEIDNLKEYISLQEIRFNDIYKINVNVDEDVYEYTIVKLILQPLVENAIYHGLYSTRNVGRVDILGYRKGNSILFEVTDNGKGMDEVEVRMLNDYINDLNNSFKSIGLKNVNKRIKLQYGNDYGITIISAPEKGTTVMATFPCVEPT